MPNQSLLRSNLGIVLAMMTAFGVLHLLAAELVPSRPSRGEVLVFKRPRPTRTAKVHDEEADVVPATAGDITVGTSADLEGDLLQGEVSTATIHWNNLSYGIGAKAGTRAILTSIDGWIKPGTLTALMVSRLEFCQDEMWLISCPGSNGSRKNNAIGCSSWPEQEWHRQRRDLRQRPSP